MLTISDNDVGGARVRRIFSIGERNVRGGETLSRDDVLAIPTPNRRALADAGYIEIYPRPAIPAPSEGDNRHMFHIGGGRYVVSGPLLTGEPVSKEDAEAIMAGRDPLAPKASTAA